MKKPVFILGVGRTGSKIYMTILNTYSNINISPELHIKSPWHKDFCTKLKKIGTLDNSKNVKRLINMMHSSIFFGSFWRGLSVGHVKLNKERLYKK